MIWNYIFEFFVQYVFGGVLYVGGYPVYYNTTLGALWNNGAFGDGNSNYLSLSTSELGFSGDFGLCFGNYLSLIATIICMALIVWFAIWLTIWIFKLVAHAFLLK